MAEKEYKLTGFEHTGFKDGARHTFTRGDLVTLNDDQYEAFKDKFEEPTAHAEPEPEKPEIFDPNKQPAA